MIHPRLRNYVLICLLLLGSPAAAQRYADQFSVEGIDVDVVGPSAEDAKIGAFKVAAKKGWKRLWDRLADPGRSSGGSLGDGDVRSVVTSIEVSKERMSGTRYLATFRIFYDPSAVRRALARAGAGFGGGTNRTMLLLPLLVDGGTTSVYEPGNIWSEAWAKFPMLRSQVEYIRADGTLADAVLLNGTEAQLREPERMRQLTARYRSDGVVIARAYVSRSFPGGPVQINVAGYTMSGQAPVAAFVLRSTTDRDLPVLFEDAIRRLDIAFAQSKDRITRASYGAPKLGVAKAFGGIAATISTPDAAALNSWTRRIAQAAAIGSVSVESLSVGGSTGVRLSSNESREYIRWSLQQSGMYMEADGFIRDALPGDASLARPKSRAELEEERVAAAEAAAALATAATTPATTPAAGAPLGSIDKVLDQVDRDAARAAQSPAKPAQSKLAPVKPAPKPAAPKPAPPLNKPQSLLPGNPG